MDKITLYVAGLDRGAKYEDVQDGECRTAVRAYVAFTGAGRRGAFPKCRKLRRLGGSCAALRCAPSPRALAARRRSCRVAMSDAGDGGSLWALWQSY